MASETSDFRPKDRITFTTRHGRALTGTILFMGAWLALVRVVKPSVEILVDTRLPTCQLAIS